MENLLIESANGTTRITINRPKALNALNRATIEELKAALDALPEDTRVVVLTGSGDRAFVAGADITEMADMGPTQAAAFARAGHALGERLEALDVPVIAEVNGFALGGGCELMLCCDFAIAGDNARISQPEVGLGVTPGFGGTTRLVRVVGRTRARQLLYTGQQLKAEQALSWGLVNEVVPAAELRARVDELAAKIAKNAPIAVQLCKRSANRGAETDLATANAYEQEIFGMCFATEDQTEGMKAFVDKRKPEWSGR